MHLVQEMLTAWHPFIGSGICIYKPFFPPSSKGLTVHQFFEPQGLILYH